MLCDNVKFHRNVLACGQLDFRYDSRSLGAARKVRLLLYVLGQIWSRIISMLYYTKYPHTMWYNGVLLDWWSGFVVIAGCVISVF